MAHTPSSPRPTLLAASTTTSYSSRTPPSATAAATALSPASTSNMVATNGATNGGVSSHSQPNLGGSINIENSAAGGGGGADYLDVAGPPAAAAAVGGRDAPRKCSTASASVMDLYGNSSQLGNRNMQRDIMTARSSACSSSQSGGHRDISGGSPRADPRKSKKFLNHWKQAASLSKIGSRTRSMLGRLKSQSQSVDVVGSAGHLESALLAGNVSEMCNADEAQDGDGDAGSGAGEPGPNAKTRWREHVWSAWVHRGFSDDVTELRTVQPGGALLTDFQKDKFRYFFFHVLDLNSDNVISSEDFDRLNERIRHYMDWNTNCIQYLAMKEVHSTFIEYILKTAANFAATQDDGKNESRNPEQMFEQWKLGFPIGSMPPSASSAGAVPTPPPAASSPSFDYWDPFKKLDALYDKMNHVTLDDVLNDEPEAEQKTCVTIDEWIDVWGTLVGKAKKLDDFPMWLQYYPKVLFDVINRTGTGIITKTELKCFYTAFLDVGKLGEQKILEITDSAFEALTSGGEVKISYHVYKLSFLNFLLGKQPNGPGQFIFGTIEPQTSTCMFPIDYSAMNATDEDIEPYKREKLEEKGSRRSVLV